NPQINRYWNHRARAYYAHQQRDDCLEANQAVWTRLLARAVSDDATDARPRHEFRLPGTPNGRPRRLSRRYRPLREHARRGRRPRPRTRRRTPAVAPEFEPESFDAITNRYGIWTLRDPLAAIFDWMRLLRPGGQFVIVDAPWFPSSIEANTSDLGFRPRPARRCCTRSSVCKCSR